MDCRRVCATPIRATSSRACPLRTVRSTTPRRLIRAGFGIYTMTNLGPLSFNNSGNPTSSLHSYANANTAGPNTPLIQFPNTAPPSSRRADWWRKP